MYYFDEMFEQSRPGFNFNVEEEISIFENNLTQRAVDWLEKYDTPVLLHSKNSDILGGVHKYGEHFLLMINVNGLTDLPSLDYLLVHELKHLEQMISGRLIIDEMGQRTLWEGMVYPRVITTASREYLEQPWEREALNAELELMVMDGMLPDVATGWKNLYDNLPTVG